MDKIVVPILLVGFNRPHCIRKVMQQLESVKPENLYISIDAPRDGKEGEAQLVEEVKQIVKNINWDCNVRYRFFERNVGAEENVSSGVTWVLQDHEYVIVNEDDIYAGYAFYKFEQDMLFRYKDDDRIGIVSGLNLTERKINDRDYYFIYGGHIWGWGTWRRVWKDYTLNETIEDKYLSDEYLSQLSVNQKQIERTRAILKHKQSLGQGKVTWDYIFWYHRIKHKYLGIVPAKNLVSNIGVEGLHARSYQTVNFTKRDDNFKVSSWRDDVVFDKDYALYTYKNSRNTSLINKLKVKLIRLYKSRFVITDSYLKDFYKS